RPHGDIWTGAQRFCYVPANALRPGFVHEPMFLPDAKHHFEVAITPAFCIATSNNHHWRLLHLCLVHGGAAEPFALLTIPHNHEPPGLQIVSAGRFESGTQNPLEIFFVNRRGRKTGGGAPLEHHLAHCLFASCSHWLSPCSMISD